MRHGREHKQWLRLKYITQTGSLIDAAQINVADRQKKTKRRAMPVLHTARLTPRGQAAHSGAQRTLDALTRRRCVRGARRNFEQSYVCRIFCGAAIAGKIAPS
jgi:hypothetical protein